MTLIWAALVVAIILAFAAGVYSLILSKRIVQIESVFKHQVDELSRELAAVNNAAMGVGQRMLVVDKKLKAFIDKLQQVEVRQDDGDNYGRAASLAEGGAVVEQLVDKFGFTEAEASLLSRINARSK